MANVTINSLPAANTIDPVNDLLAIYQNSSVSTLSISRNTFLGLASAPVGLTDSQTLTNKILTSPTINTPTVASPTFSGTLSGTYTIGGTPTFPSSVVTLTGSQTLTNKVLTAPTITNATISADTISGFSTANSGTIYGIAVSSATITGANTVSGGALTTNSIPSGVLQQNSVSAANLATNAIKLGYTQITGNLTTSSTSYVQATGLTVTVTIPSGGRSVKITGYARSATNGTSNAYVQLSIWDGTVGSGTQLSETANGTIGTGEVTQTTIAVVTPAAGSKTYNIGWKVSSGTATMTASAVGPTFILVEVI